MHKYFNFSFTFGVNVILLMYLCNKSHAFLTHTSHGFITKFHTHSQTTPPFRYEKRSLNIIESKTEINDITINFLSV